MLHDGPPYANGELHIGMVHVLHYAILNFDACFDLIVVWIQLACICTADPDSAWHCPVPTKPDQVVNRSVNDWTNVKKIATQVTSGIAPCSRACPEDVVPCVRACPE